MKEIRRPLPAQINMYHKYFNGELVTWEDGDQLRGMIWLKNTQPPLHVITTLKNQFGKRIPAHESFEIVMVETDSNGRLIPHQLDREAVTDPSKSLAIFNLKIAQVPPTISGIHWILESVKNTLNGWHKHINEDQINAAIEDLKNSTYSE